MLKKITLILLGSLAFTGVAAAGETILGVSTTTAAVVGGAVVAGAVVDNNEMTDAELAEALTNSTNIEQTVQRLIGQGLDASRVVKAAIKAQPSKAGSIKAAAMASVPPGERTAVAAAADDAVSELQQAAVSAAGTDDADDATEAYTAAVTSLASTGGDSDTSIQAASEATNG